MCESSNDASLSSVQRQGPDILDILPGLEPLNVLFARNHVTNLLKIVPLPSNERKPTAQPHGAGTCAF